MAKVTLVLVDESGDQVRFRAEFDPPLKAGLENATSAQLLGAVAMDKIQEMLDQVSDNVEIIEQVPAKESRGPSN